MRAETLYISFHFVAFANLGPNNYLLSTSYLICILTITQHFIEELKYFKIQTRMLGCSKFHQKRTFIAEK